MRALAVGAAMVGLAGCALGEVTPSSRPAPYFPAVPEPPPVSWDAASGKLSCGLLQGAISVPADVRQLVELSGSDEAELVLRADRHGALVVTARGVDRDLGILERLFELAIPSEDLLLMWVNLFEKVEPDWPALKIDEVKLRGENGRFVMDYETAAAPLLHWRLVYVRTYNCRAAALERVGPDDNPRLTALLDGLRSDN